MRPHPAHQFILESKSTRTSHTPTEVSFRSLASARWRNLRLFLLLLFGRANQIDGARIESRASSCQGTLMRPHPAHPFILAPILLALASAGIAQSIPAKSADPPAVFDVAVIRPNPGDLTGHSHIWSSATDGHFKAQNVTALALIRYAYSVPETRIDGGPSWMRSKAFDLEAKSDPATDDQLSKLPSAEARERKQRMLQSLLADRFALKVHEETRTLPVYALVMVKDGPKFGPSQKNGTTVNSYNGNGNRSMTVQGSDHTIRLLAEELSKTVGRVVVDKTGLDGRFDLTVKWVADDVATAGSDLPSGPSLFTALQEQLGLKLESEKGPVQVLVVDHVDLPSGN